MLHCTREKKLEFKLIYYVNDFRRDANQSQACQHNNDDDDNDGDTSDSK